MSARITTLAALWLCGCASTMREDPPALVIEPDAASHAELVRVVSTALNVPSVTIAADALTRESTLIIERRPARGPSGQRLSGRDFGQPEQFQLTTDGKTCSLVRLSTGERYALAKTRCRPEAGESG